MAAAARVPAPGETILALEGMRGVAALMVACYHGWDVPGIDLIPIANSWLWVDFFFVLSGAVMVHAYDARLESPRQAADYLVRRFGRLYPLHVATLALFAAAVAAVPALKSAITGRAYDTAYIAAQLPVADLLPNLALLQGMGVVDHLSFNYPSWSISVEFWTYTVFATVCIVVSRKWRAGAFAAAAGLGLVCLMLLSPGESIQVDHDYGFVRCLYGFFVGAVVASLAREGFSASRTGIAALAAVVMILLLAQQAPRLTYVFPLAAAWLVSAAWRGETGMARAFAKAPLVRLGTVSYAVYMLHAPLLVFFKPLALSVDDPMVAAALYVPYLVALLLAAGVAHRGIEVPGRDAFRRIADHLGALNRIGPGGQAPARSGSKPGDAT